MGKLADALKRKYKTPHEAIRALGLDEALLRSEIVGDSMPLVLREPPGRAYDYGYGFGLAFDASPEEQRYNELMNKFQATNVLSKAENAELNSLIAKRKGGQKKAQDASPFGDPGKVVGQVGSYTIYENPKGEFDLEWNGRVISTFKTKAEAAKRAREGQKKYGTDAATEAGLKDDEPRDVIGTKGMQNKPFRKRFPNAKAMDRWMDGEGGSGDYDISYIQRA